MRSGLVNSAHQLMRSAAVQTRFGKEAARSVVEMLRAAQQVFAHVHVVGSPGRRTLNLRLEIAHRVVVALGERVMCAREQMGHTLRARVR